MELLYASLLSFFFLLGIYLLHRYLLSHKNSKSGGNKKLLPGKTGFPVIGESLAFISAGWKGHPEKFMFDRIAKYSSNVFKTSLAGSPMVVFCGANANKFIFSNESKLVQITFTKSLYKIFPFLTQTTSNQEFMRLRKMILDILRPVALKGFIGTMDNITYRHFVTNWERRDTVVVSPSPTATLFRLLFACFLASRIQTMLPYSKNMSVFLLAGIFSLPIDLPGTPLNRAIKAFNFIRKELLVIIKQRKIDLAEGNASPTQDILSHMLLKSDDNGKFMHEEVIADQIFGMIIGGQDTITSVCSSIVNYLAELPEVYQRVYREQLEIAKSKAPGESLHWDDIQKMKYSWNVACEVLRVQPPVQGGFRDAITDFMYNGFSIPKGWKIYWSVNSTHKNHEHFPEPQKFDPSRFEGSGPAPYTFIPFGGGPRMCPGNEYARLAMLVFMHHLVKRFRWEKLVPGEKLIYDIMPKPEKGLPIRLFPHET